MNITIIGAGPIGSYAAYLLAKSGHDIDVYDQKKEIGFPVQCSGILTSDFDRFGLSLPGDVLLNTFQKIEINSCHKGNNPGKNNLSIRQKDYLLSRSRFDLYLADLARSAGARYHLQHQFIGREGNNLLIKNIPKGITLRLNPDFILAADGPLSPVAKSFGLYPSKRINHLGIQAVVTGNFDSLSIKTYFAPQFSPDFFAWVVPESPSSARIGLISDKNPRLYLENFLGFLRNEPSFSFSSLEIREVQAGLIPLYSPQQRLYHDNCFLLGDAAGFVKATTLGGIVPGMAQAQILINCLNRHKTKLKIKQDYLRSLRPLRRDLWLHLQVHRLLGRFSHSDWNKLLQYSSQKRIIQLLERYTRDHPLPLFALALLKEPRYLRFVKYLV
jgi:geranylgeranyl reductase family protein